MLAVDPNFIYDPAQVPIVTVSATDPEASQAGDPGAYTIYRTGDLSGSLTVAYTAAGSATPGADYNALSGTAVIPSGEASTAVSVTPNASSTTAGTKLVVLDIQPCSGYSVGAHASGVVAITSAVQATQNQATVAVTAFVINSSEGPPLPPEGPEAGPGSAPPTNPQVSVSFSRTGGDLESSLTASYLVSGSAASGVHYTGLGPNYGVGTIEFPAGVMTTSVVVTPVYPFHTPGSETLVVSLLQPQGEEPAWVAGGAEGVGGQAVVVLNAPQAPAPGNPPGTGLTGRYYNQSGTPRINQPTWRPDFSQPDLTRIDPQVNFAWVGSPGSGVNSDFFFVQWSGQVKTQAAGTYTFTTNVDDGVRLWVNGQLIINNWNDHFQTVVQDSGQIVLGADQKYDIVMEYFDNQLGATAQLSWTPPGQAQSQTIPQSALYPTVANFGAAAANGTGNGLYGTYFNNQNFRWCLTDVARLDEITTLSESKYGP